MRPSRTIAVFLVAVACGIALAVLGTTSAAADDGPDLAAIDRYVRSEMDAQRIPGLALGIVHGDRIVHVQGFGQADRSGRQVTPETPFLIGSVTKSFTALAIMQLSEAGRVQLDAPVQRYLPWWRVADPDASTRVTVRHLLYQVSGLSKATGNAYATSGDTHDSALEDRVRALRDAELTEPVGTTWQYSNANYWTLGMIVQAVSGQSYETYVQQHIFDPLQMGNSYTSRTEAARNGLPTGHRYWYGFPVASEVPFDRGGLGSGGLSSSAQDMASYLSLYLNQGRHGGTALVSPAGAAELQRAGVPTGRDGVSYAMGWDVGQVRGTTAISHDGSGFDSHANVVLIPERQLGRRSDGERGELAGRVLRLAPHDRHRVRRRRPADRRGSASHVVEPVAVGGLRVRPGDPSHSGRRDGPERADHPYVAHRPITTSDGSPAHRTPSWPAPSRELDLGPSRAGRTAAGHPRTAAGRADGTARPRLPAAGQRRPRLRLGPGPGHLGNPHFAHPAYPCVYALEAPPPI